MELPSLRKPPEDPNWNLTAKTNLDNLEKDGDDTGE